jgi:hypothetical protein
MRFGRSTPGRLVAVVAFTAATTLALSTPALASGAAPEQGLQQSAPRAVATAPPVAPPTLPAPPKTAPNKPGNPAVATPTPTGVGPQVSTPVITCSANVQNPHNSSHVNGTVNVVVTLLCTATVPQINIRAALYRNGVLVKDSGQRTINNNVVAQNNAAEPCHNATYQGWMSYGVLFPPGYTPQTGASSGFGNVVNIIC